MCNSLEKLIRIKKLIKSDKISYSEKNDLMFLSEFYISNIRCANCVEEQSEIISFGMLRHFCQLTNRTTRSFNDVFDNKNVNFVQEECPIKKITL